MLDFISILLFLFAKKCRLMMGMALSKIGLLIGLFFFFAALTVMAYRILVPWPEIESMLPPVEVQSHISRTAKEVPLLDLFFFFNVFILIGG